MNPHSRPAKLQFATDAIQLLSVCGSMLTRQPNPRTRVEVRKDPQEPATSSHVSLTPKSFAAPPPPPWLRPAARRRAALPLLLGAPRRHRWCGRWPRHLHPRRREPIPAGPVALPPSTPPLPRPAAPRTAMKRAPDSKKE